MLIRRWIPYFLVAVICGCGASRTPEPVSGPASGSGWEIRYNATLALSHRGSEKFQDPVVQDLMLEMLDEPQQRRNFRSTGTDGGEVTDIRAAHTAIIGALNALSEYHRQRPTADFKHLKPAIDKLAAGPDPALAGSARTLLEELGKSPESPHS